MQKLIIEARINERMMREQGNPNVPYIPEEIAADAAACRRAGAAIVHYHAREPDGAGSTNPDVYARSLHLIRQTTDVLIHPTLGGEFMTDEATAEQRLFHIVRMARATGGVDFAPIDVGSGNVDRYDPVARRFVSEGLIYKNSSDVLVYFADHMRQNGIKPMLVCWDIGFIRHAKALIDMGLVNSPAFFYLILSGDSILTFHPGTPRGLQAMLDFLPRDKDLQWTVANYGGNLFSVAAAAISQGGHISIGLGDYPYSELGQPTNAELVAEVVSIARTLGREVATPTEARAILGLKPQSLR